MHFAVDKYVLCMDTILFFRKSRYVSQIYVTAIWIFPSGKSEIFSSGKYELEWVTGLLINFICMAELLIL